MQNEQPPEDRRPWGHFVVLAETPTHKLKRIVVEGGGRLSLQRHRHRREHWYVVGGTGRVTVDDRELAIGPGSAIDIPAGAWHRIAADEGEPVVVIEVQTGTYFGEDDIERREDDYGRV